MPLPQQDEFGANCIANDIGNITNVSMPLPQQDEFGELNSVIDMCYEN